jgi:hypothetical protein
MGAAALSLLRHLQSARLPRSDLPNLSRLQPRACTSWLLCSQQRGVTKFCQINANDVLDFCDRRNAVSFSLLHRTKVDLFLKTEFGEGKSARFHPLRATGISPKFPSKLRGLWIRPTTATIA